jgi:superfamily I DNA and/or RNA helicase
MSSALEPSNKAIFTPLLLSLYRDHQQLRPKAADYYLERYKGLGISLFERLVNAGVAHVTLENQHRMRQDISRLIRGTIYPTLIDHPVC